jgi:hypothetical protein
VIAMPMKILRGALFLGLFFILKLLVDCEDHRSEKKFPDLAKWVAKAEHKKGFFDLYLMDEKLFLVLPHKRLRDEFFMFSSLSAGNYGGVLVPSMSLKENLLYFKRQGNRILLLRRDLSHRAKKDSPEAKSLQKAHLDSLVHGFKILAEDTDKKSYLISLNAWLWKPNAQEFPAWLGRPVSFQAKSLTQTWWTQIRSFPDNIDLEVQTTLKGKARFTAPERSNQLRLTFSLVRKKETGYQARPADDRVGYFTQDQMDFSSPTEGDGILRTIERWNLQKSDPSLEVSVVKAPIVFHLRADIPERFRMAVRDGVLEWNKSFEPLGFVGAIEVHLPRQDQDIDPADIRYSTISWAANPTGLALRPYRSNPETGEILDSDIVIGAGLEHWFFNRARLLKEAPKQEDPLFELFSRLVSNSGNDALDLLRDFKSNLARQKWWAKHNIYPCQILNLSQRKRLLDVFGTEKESLRVEGKGQRAWAELALKNLVMHTVGHALGLRHNFKASALVKSSDLSDPSWNRHHQPNTSVMDYPDLNLTQVSKNQGKILNDSLGEYDYKAIAYGYQPIPDEKELRSSLESLAQSLRSSGLEYASDEDLFLSQDPKVQVEDQGDDLIQSATERLGVVGRLLQSVEANTFTSGDRYFKLRETVFTLIFQVLQKTWQLTRYIGGVETHRDHVGDSKGLLPYAPLSREDQERTLDFFQNHIFREGLFTLPDSLLSRLSSNSFEMESNAPIALDHILAFLRIFVVWECLSERSFQSLSSYHQKLAPSPMTLDFLFQRIYEMVFEDLSGKLRAEEIELTAVDMESQRFYLRHLVSLQSQFATFPARVGVLVGHSLGKLKRRLLSLLGRAMADDPIEFQLRLKTQRSFEGSDTRVHFEDLLASIEQIESARMLHGK